jgi:superfamily II RNA helicase
MSHSYLIQPDLTSDPDDYTIPIPFTFSLDPFQKHAICAIQKEHNVLVCAKTGSGKTLVGEYQIHYSLSKNKRVFYTTPIKSLSNQKFHDLVHQYPMASVGIMTGDIKFCPDAQIIVMTTEILRNLLYKHGTQTAHLGLTASLSLDDLDAVIFDECHYINDPDRGKVWEETMILLPPAVKLILLSATLDHPELFADWLGALKERPIHLIQTSYRIVPLTHTVLSGETFQPIMDAKEVFYDKPYNDWLKARVKAQDDHKAFQRAVRDARLTSHEGPVSGKTRPVSFTHQLNETVGLMQRTNKLPALFFVLSRKNCENYAARISHDLLTSSESADVNHIIGFHLSRYKASMETLPQFHRICDLLKRGIAFHHSGLLPLLKEIVEILFSRGFVRLLFATETFAVGLNMPTKTVVFTGLKKYDDQTGGMRLLRTDEYIQMAGRAGRRGKDTEGLVVYLPDYEPVDLCELRSIMKGARTPIQSRMDFHYDFLMKTLQTGSIKWITLMEKSYWFRQRAMQIRQITDECSVAQDRVRVLESTIPSAIFAQVDDRNALEDKIRQSTNAARKDAQRQLVRWDNDHTDAASIQAIKLYDKYSAYKKEITTHQSDLKLLNAHQDQLRPVIEFLKCAKFLEPSGDTLTKRGILATEINEGHPILMTELYLSGKASKLSGEELVAMLSAFLEFDAKMDEASPTTMSSLCTFVSVKDILCTLDTMATDFMKIEDSISGTLSPAGYWSLSLSWIEPIQQWLNGGHIAMICKSYAIFEGNFTRAILKVNNLLDEWLSLATFCNDPEQIEAIVAVKPKLVRDVVLPDSLYLRL